MPTNAIAVQLYTLRDVMQTAEEIRTGLKRVAEIGYGAVQVAGLGPLKAAEWRTLLDENGLACCGWHVGHDRIVNDPSAVGADAHALGCPTVTVPAMPGDYRNEAGMRNFGAMLDKAGANLKTMGLRLGYHNHSFEFEKYAGQIGLELLYSSWSPANVFPELDLFWVQHGGGNPAAWLRRYAQGAPLVHCKDFAIVENKQLFAPVGEGNLDWDDILAATKECGIRWHVVEQDQTYGRDPFDCVASSFRFLQSKGLA